MGTWTLESIAQFSVSSLLFAFMLFMWVLYRKNFGLANSSIEVGNPLTDGPLFKIRAHDDIVTEPQVFPCLSKEELKAWCVKEQKRLVIEQDRSLHEHVNGFKSATEISLVNGEKQFEAIMKSISSLQNRIDNLYTLMANK